MGVTPTPLPMWMDRPLSHTSVHTCSEWRKGWVCNALCATRTHKHLCICLHMCPPHARTMLQQGGVVKCGTLIQVALTDLEDVVDGGGQSLAYGGYV
ncbi:hypothetical protein PBY51_022458 [Eleginops maclovinus]|uniref:Uncharacterized protein n=1 Tax=Eleginops maclovinus TaxID=56733 RepID=A0AAN7XHQ2_ELEMC|nr:hypothetical protein PBY51_022458 [Eleginops maclovinus]